MIPAAQYSKRSADMLMQYLCQELTRTKGEREHTLDPIWIKYHRLYRAQPEFAVKNFPWPGAANLVIPLIATDVDIIYSRLMALLFAPGNLWSVTAWQPDMVQYAPRIQEFLQWAQENELDAYNVIADWILELAKLGTAVIKTRYTRETKNVFEFRELQSLDGTTQSFQRVARLLLKDHPSIHHVDLFNFYAPATTRKLQETPWCAEKLSLTWAQVINRMKAGIYTNIHQLGSHWARGKGGLVEQALQRQDHFVPSQGDKFEPYEFWTNWDINEDGEQEALVCTVHLETRTYLRIDYNPFFNQEYPYDVARYLRTSGRFYGIGLSEMLEYFQEEVTTMHNQRIDRSTVQNASVILQLKDGSISQNEVVYPGKKLLVNDLNSMRTMSLGSPLAGSTIPDENMTLQYAQRRDGVSDYISGSDNPSINYATATTATGQLREGAKRFDQVLREVRSCLNGVGTKVLELYQQFNQGGKPFTVLGEKDGQVVHQVLQFPLDIIRSGMSVDVTATSAAHNKEIELRTNEIIFQRITMLYGQLLQYVQLMVQPQIPPQMKEVAEQAARSGTIMLKKMLDNYGLQDADTIAPDIERIINGNQSQLAQLQASLGGGGSMAPQFGEGAPVENGGGYSAPAAGNGQGALGGFQRA